ncbi:putative pectinesterase/pectinesterase inhibitor 28 [Aristolochia californica]|uniref:putative pectinesterase/pectinesterase inhibitor 28 n=1 Tax=Aristolochia californica TaxID=171875 RepID=UPI0035DD9DBC
MAGGYGQVNGQNEGGGKKKIVIAGLTSLVLVAMVVAVTVSVNHHQGSQIPNAGTGGGEGEVHTSMKAIKAICQPTDYKETCESSLSGAAGNTTDPKELIKMAFEVTLDEVKKVLNNSTLLKNAQSDPLTKEALNNCEELMEYAIDDLKTSLGKLGAFDISKLDDAVEDVKIWLSAVVTYQETCLDGFEGADSETGKKMKKLMEAASELTSNILAMVTELSSIVSGLDLQSLLHRRLLESSLDMPEWISESGRHLLAADGATAFAPNATVAQDGSGKFKTINEAVATIPLKSNDTFVIYVKEGVYKEQVVIDKTMWNVVMIGDGPDKTKVTGSLNFIDGTPTFKTATFAAIGEGFMAKDMAFENTAGAEKHQAVALRVQSDRSVFYNCRMDAYQDTLYFHTKRQFYRDCTISGTVDFMFGNAAVVFQNCILVARKPLDNQQNIITAQGRKDKREPTGMVLHNCTIVAEPEYLPLKNKLPTYLGRPWKEYSRTFYIQSDLGDFVHPDGWLPWLGDFALNTCFYAEYDNRGLAAVTTNRAKWRGIKTLTPDRVQRFTVRSFIRGQQWIPKYGVPFTPDLYSSL